MKSSDQDQVGQWSSFLGFLIHAHELKTKKKKKNLMQLFQSLLTYNKQKYYSDTG